ncbi:hypothetical protein [Roseateles sp.]|uniref:hypothetical protein n=1 Tax=Roseateles sp. TaxID=1971397 RepID=UPI00391876CE
MGPRGVRVEVLDQRWQRDIEVERLLLESGSAWYDELPAGAQDISRRWLEDPQGSRGRAEHCRYYQLPTWRPRRSARSEGLSAAAPAPFWAPTPTLEPEVERLGRRREHYELRLAAADGRNWQCAGLTGEHGPARERAQAEAQQAAEEHCNAQHMQSFQGWVGPRDAVQIHTPTPITRPPGPPHDPGTSRPAPRSTVPRAARRRRHRAGACEFPGFTC